MKRLPKNNVVWCRQGDFPGFYGFCPSEVAWHAELKKRKVHEPYPKTEGTTTTFEPSSKGNSIIILVTVSDRLDNSKEASALDIIGLIVHEATHVWQRICENMGEKFPGRECEAYSIQAIASELLTAYSRTRRKIL